MTYFKTFQCLLLILISISTLLAQESELPPRPLALSYHADELPATITLADKQRIAQQLVRLCGAEQFIASSQNSAFGIFPRLDIIEAYTAEGLQNLQAVKIDFSVSFREMESGINLGGHNWTLTGTGPDQRRAMMAALRKIPRQDAEFTSHLQEIRLRLDQYYAANCTAILARADQYIITDEFDKAIAELVKVPTEAERCSAQAQEKLQQAYDEYQRIHCGPILQEARAAMANRQFSKALDLLLLISPTSSCGPDATAMMNRIGQARDQLHQQKFAFAQQVHQQRLSTDIARQNLRIQRWIGITEIAKTVGGIADIFNPSIDLTYDFNNRTLSLGKH